MDDDITANYHGGNAESIEAKALSRLNAGRDRIRIGRLAEQRSAYGITCDEAEVLLNLAHQTCSARFSEMKRDGILVMTQMRRETRNGGKARVMVIRGTIIDGAA